MLFKFYICHIDIYVKNLIIHMYLKALILLNVHKIVR